MVGQGCAASVVMRRRTGSARRRRHRADRSTAAVARSGQPRCTRTASLAGHAASDRPNRSRRHPRRRLADLHRRWRRELVHAHSRRRSGDRGRPGMAESARSILDPLAALGVGVEDVTDVVLGHHHPDHTIHAGHFPNAAIHDHWAIYRGTDWEDSECDGRVLAPSVVLARTPGHTAQDLAVVVGTPDGIVVCTHSLVQHRDDGRRRDSRRRGRAARLAGGDPRDRERDHPRPRAGVPRRPRRPPASEAAVLALVRRARRSPRACRVRPSRTRHVGFARPGRRTSRAKSRLKSSRG